MKSTFFEERGFTLAWEKIFIVRDENGSRVETKLFFSLPFEKILKPFIDKLNALYEWEPGMRGAGPITPVAMLKAVIYAKLNNNMSDRKLERHLLRNPEIANALGFTRIPSHKTISFFKNERLDVEFLNEIFISLRDHLFASGKIDYSSVTIDSAPVKAFVNLPKANREKKLNDMLACAMFNDPIYKSVAKALVEAMSYKSAGLSQVDKRIACLNIVVLYELGGFLARSKVVKYLEKEKHSALLTAISPAGPLPSDVTLSGFQKHIDAMVGSPEFTALRKYLDNFYAAISETPECSLNLFFPEYFGVLQDSFSLVDPDARLGYCASKKLAFLGYRVQLVIDDKKNFRSS